MSSHPLDVFSRYIHDMAAAFNLSMSGLGRERELLEAQLAVSEQDGNADPKLFLGTPESIAKHGPYAAVNVRAAIAGATKGSRYWVLLGWAWASAVYAGWEYHFRGEIANAPGVPQKDISSPVMGDLRLIRHDIEHELGIVTSANSGNCAVLKWAAVGDLLNIGEYQIEEFMRQIEPEIGAWRRQANALAAPRWRSPTSRNAASSSAGIARRHVVGN